jgi:glutamine synthetase
MDGSEAVDLDSADDDTILLEYVDLNGISRGMFIPEDSWDRAVEDGVGFGSIILDWYESHNSRGITEASNLGPSEGEIQAVADPDSLVPVPWVDSDIKKANCDLLHNGDPTSMCSRSVLGNVLDLYHDMDFTTSVGTELEYNVFTELDAEELERGEAYLREVAATKGSPYATRPIVDHSAYVTELATTMRKMGGSLEGIHKESTLGHYEAILEHSSALQQADTIMSFRMAARGVGRQHDHIPTFMPRPMSEFEGNSQHYHFSLWRDSQNAFNDPSDERGLSDTGRQFVGGILEHARGLTALCSSTVNSYKRLQPGLWAPIDISYGYDNKTCPVRIPHGRGDATRVEVRIPDSYANPYLAMAGILAAGFDGIRREIDPGEPVTSDIFEEGADPENSLPTSLDEALTALQADDFLRETLGEEGIAQYVALKRNESERYRQAITDWEVREYVDQI